jgi:DNA-binding transcriptional LysR family regulator
MTEEAFRVPPLSALRALEAVARLKGVTAAARELQISHPAVSQALSRLEAEIGQPVLSKSGAGPTPTELGRELIDVYSEMVARLRRIYRSQAPTLLRLRVAAPSLLAQFWFAQIDPAASQGVEFSIGQDGADGQGGEACDLSVVRTAGSGAAGLHYVAPERLVLAVPATHGDVAPLRRPLFYTASMWAPFLDEEALARHNLQPAAKNLIAEPGVCLALAEAHGGACLFDEDVLRQPKHQRDWRIIEGSRVFTGFSYGLRATREVLASHAARPVLKAWLQWTRHSELVRGAGVPRKAFG